MRNSYKIKKFDFTVARMCYNHKIYICTNYLVLSYIIEI